MADKDKKLRVILKLPSKASKGAGGASSRSSQNVQAPPSPRGGMPQKPAAPQMAPSNAINNRVATPPKKRKFKTLVEGDAVPLSSGREDHGGGFTSGHGGVATPVAAPPVVRAPLPPLAKKPSHKKKEKPFIGEGGASLSNPGIGTVRGSTSAPAKKVLEGVLDKLKKKDTYGVFSEPVDSRLVPDYYDVIKEPMDFGTMYKKINKGAYSTLSLFEKDIMLICSNAMRYNGPDTIYYKQARSIQDAAQKALDVVAAQVGMPEFVKPVSHKKQPHTAKKGWKGTAAVKNLLEPANSDYASGATLATEGDDGSLLSKVEVGRLKKGAPSDRSGSVAEEEAGWAVQSHGNVGLESEALNPDLQDEAGAALKPATLKDGRRPLSTDEYHRSSYRPRNLPAHGRGPPVGGVGGELHVLVPTGPLLEHAYAKSLSQFATKIGPEGWKLAARRMQRVLAPHVPFGKGWVGEQEAPLGTIFRPPPASQLGGSAADGKVIKTAMKKHNASVTTMSGLPGISAASHTPASTSYLHTPNIAQAHVPSPLGQTSMDSLLTRVTSAMLASGASSQGMVQGKPVMDLKPEKVMLPVYQLEQGRGPGMASSSDSVSAQTSRPMWSSQPLSNQAITPSVGMMLQSSSGLGTGVSSRWTGTTSQGAPTFVYSTAVRTVPASTGIITGQDEGSKAQARTLGLLQAEANARAMKQSTFHLSQAPRPAQYVQKQLYTNTPYGLHSSAGLAHSPFDANQLVSSSQPLLPSEKQESGSLKVATSAPLQLQVGAKYGVSQTQINMNPTSLHQTHTSKPPPDLNLQPVDSPSTPQAPSQQNALGLSQPSLSLQL